MVVVDIHLLPHSRNKEGLNSTYSKDKIFLALNKRAAHAE